MEIWVTDELYETCKPWPMSTAQRKTQIIPATNIQEKKSGATNHKTLHLEI